MSRHRNVRSLRYSDEYDGYDDVYGNSVEEDYPMSPSDAAFFYDRNNRHPQLSSFIRSEDIQEEDEQAGGAGSKPEMDKKLADCLAALRGVVGDTKPDNQLIPVILDAKFDVQAALNALYANEDVVEGTAAPKPQRSGTDRRRGKEVKKNAPQKSRFNVVQFLKSKVNQKIDFLATKSQVSDGRPRKRKHPLLNTRISTVGYYLCKKAVEVQTPPLKKDVTQIPKGIFRFKFDVPPLEDRPVTRKA